MLLTLSLAAADARAGIGPQPEAAPQDMQQSEFEAARDRIYSSLMYRGELADKIIDSGKAHEIVKLEGEATYSNLRLALLDWIKKNPDKAARLALNFRSGVKFSEDPIRFRVSVWKINEGFLEKIKALNAASRDSRVSPEMLELAAKRLYEGTAAGAGGDAVTGGARRGGGSDFFSLNYADYKLNRSGLRRELAGAGGVLDALRGPGGKGQAGAEKAYEAAISRYGAFVVAASALKGRDVITGGESAALEERRAGLRSALAALTLRGRAADLRGIAGGLAAESARPGLGALASAAASAGGGSEAAAARIEGGRLTPGELRALVARGEEEFAAFYLRFSVYSGLLGLKKKSEGLGFSCVYDYLLWRWLAWFFPGAPYVKARSAAEAAGAGLEAAMLKAGEGDLAGALEGPGGRAEELEAALAAVRGDSAANRAAQFFLWGVVFRPLEIEVSARGGRPFFQPALTFYAVTGPRETRPAR